MSIRHLAALLSFSAAVLAFPSIASAQTLGVCEAEWLDRAAFEAALRVELTGLEEQAQTATIDIEDCTPNSARIRVQLADARTDHRLLDLSDVSPQARIRVTALMAADLVRFLRDAEVPAPAPEPPAEPVETPATDLQPPPEGAQGPVSEFDEAPEERERPLPTLAPVPEPAGEEDEQPFVTMGVAIGGRWFASDAEPLTIQVRGRIADFVLRIHSSTDSNSIFDENAFVFLGDVEFFEVAVSGGLQLFHLDLPWAVFLESDLLATMGYQEINTTASFGSADVVDPSHTSAMIGGSAIGRIGFALGPVTLHLELELGVQVGTSASVIDSAGFPQRIGGFDGVFAGLGIGAGASF